MLAHSIVLLLFSLLLVCPGLLVKKYLRGFNNLLGFIFSVFVSLAFWLCAVWYISLVHAPLHISLFVLLVVVSAITIFVFRHQFSRVSFTGIIAFIQKQPLSRIILLLAVLLYLFPFAMMSIPPGSDITMHSYITRLIINNNGLPENYDPIIPNSPFGSYSAGYQALTAMICGVTLPPMREAIILMSVAVYALGLLSLVFFYSQLVSEKMAIYAGIITFSINSTLPSIIGWGGNPTMLSMAFCLFCFGAVLFAVKHSDTFVFRILALPLAAIPLVHAIPAITFFYLSIPAYLLLLWFNKEKTAWIIKNTLICGTLAVILLLPFILHFKSENSPELTHIIKRWQNEMMGNKLTDNLAGNIAVVFDQIKYRTGDPMVITSVISIVFLLVFKRFKPVAVIGIFAVCIFLLVLNCCYWVLPLSEVLYPERVSYFMIPLLGIAIAFFLDSLTNITFSIGQRRLFPASILVFVLLMTGLVKYRSDYAQRVLKNNPIVFNSSTMDAFHWIENHTSENDVFRCSYGDAGMWIPAFANRPTLGAHIHFIHEVSHVKDILENRPGPKYIFVTAKDVREQTTILSFTKDKTPVFKNEEVSIFY